MTVLNITRFQGSLDRSAQESASEDGYDSDTSMREDGEEGALKDGQTQALVTPGELVTDDSIWMRGHGTYFLDGKTYSSVAGTIVRVNKLLTVNPLRGRYIPVIGDHVIGRITEVGNRRWKVDIGSHQDAVLLLGSVNLPGGVLRRKSESDELQMRQFLKEGDLLNAEIQSIYSDGGASLHTRSLRYGKLRNGYFVSIPSSLVIRSKIHVHHLPGNVDLILGVNGYIWLSSHSKTKLEGASSANVPVTRLEEEAGLEIYSDVNDIISSSIRETIARYGNCLRALASEEIGINRARLVSAYEASLVYENGGELVENDVKQAIAMEAIIQEHDENE